MLLRQIKTFFRLFNICNVHLRAKVSIRVRFERSVELPGNVHKYLETELSGLSWRAIVVGLDFSTFILGKLQIQGRCN